MTSLPSSLSLTSIATGADVDSAPLRNNFSAIQTAVNGLITDFSGGVAGQVLVAASSTAVAWGGTYTAYTPTWASSGTAVSLGNGTITGRYLQFGKWVTGKLTLTTGSSTTYGTGFYTFTLPVAPSLAVNDSVGTCFAVVAGSGVSLAPVYVSGSTICLFTFAYPAVLVATTVPGTFASGDSVHVNFFYEAA